MLSMLEIGEVDGEKKLQLIISSLDQRCSTKMHGTCIDTDHLWTETDPHQAGKKEHTVAFTCNLVSMYSSEKKLSLV